MQRTIYIELERNNEPENAHHVKLESEDGTFGIKNLTDNIVTIGVTSDISNPTKGRYEYTFQVQNGKTYLVSWRIVASDGDEPIYRTEQIGPFYTIDEIGIRAIADFKGTFQQGSLSSFLLKITTFDGDPVNAQEISVRIQSENAYGEEVDLTSNIPDNVIKGFYIFDWQIDEEQETGEYNIIWKYVVEDIEKSETQKFIIVAKERNESSFFLGRIRDFRFALEHYIRCAQSIPVYFEQAKPSRDRKTFYFTFSRWNQSPGVIIYKNKNIVNEGVEVDYFKGKIVFDGDLIIQDVINADYNFKWFSDEDLDRFLNNSLEMMNSYPPHSAYTLATVPNRYIPTVLYGAARDALRQLMMCLQFQESQRVFGGSENAQKAFSNLETIKQNYEKDWEKTVEQKKYGPYVGLTRIIVTPEYTLPGGRSRWFRYLFSAGT